MRINISAWSIRRPVPAIVLFAVLMLLGTLSFKQLPVTRFPNIDIPLISIVITQSGAAPAELETQVTKIVEDSVANITGVKHITSTLTAGLSSTVLEFRLGTDTDRSLNDVRDAVAKVRADLPRTIDEPIVERIDVEQGDELEGLKIKVLKRLVSAKRFPSLAKGQDVPRKRSGFRRVENTELFIYVAEAEFIRSFPKASHENLKRVMEWLKSTDAVLRKNGKLTSSVDQGSSRKRRLKLSLKGVKQLRREINLR